MPVLTVRISDKEKNTLARRAKAAGVKPAALVRQLITEEPFHTAADVLADLERRMGDETLRMKRRA